MQKKKTMREWAAMYLQIVLGAAFYAAGFQFFLYPNAITTGGVTGIAVRMIFKSCLAVSFFYFFRGCVPADT